jgi:hypothetical protein
MAHRRSSQMKSINIRMSESAWEAVQAEARREGVSASEFVRESVFFRLGYRFAKRMDDDELVQRLARIGLLPPR